MNELLNKRREQYEKEDYPCYYCGCDLTDSKNYECSGVHIYKVAGLPVYVCSQCHEEKQQQDGYYSDLFKRHSDDYWHNSKWIGE